MPTVIVKYSELVTLSVMQLFYSNKICRSYQSTPVLDFTIVPTAECQAFMQAKNMVFRNTGTNGGFTVLAATSGKTITGNNIIRNKITKADKLSFFMVLRNPELINFDLLPTTLNKGNIYYFSNQVKDLAAVRNNLHLTKNVAGVDGNADQLKKATANYKYNFAGVITAADAKVKHLLTGATVTASSVIVQNTLSDITFNLSALPSGCCQLLVNNVVTDTFYFLGTMANQQIFGVVELSLSSALPANYRIIEPDQSLVTARPNYVVLFKNRQTFWRYTIQLQTNSAIYLEMSKLSPVQKTDFIKQLGISANDTNVKFKLLSNTDLSLVFVSLANIALMEKYTSTTSAAKDPLIITLNKYINTPAKKAVIKTNLPYPSTATIDAGSLPAIYSDVFITL
ncbi:hypothetical protein [Mucilaginibacter xinganensis]|uniref:Uncharacterized protein n=1 Tax=Mucilaginibacter xinganensis TaxID=1234841 RepID=A0A223NVI9_9SPHI|nr:hypothetical protein [Mucilaginibacter xinganensis]ASU33899.1 hypothetical protein MuYL_2007 [Mucilaginibacter xinganensis]